jgi:acyl carrier protein
VDTHQPSTLEQVVAVAGTVLGEPCIEASDNLFDRGGDSLTVIRFCAELEAQLGVRVPVDLVWDADDFSVVATRIAPLAHSAGGA